MLWIRTPYWTYLLQIFSPIQQAVFFILLMIFFTVEKLLSLTRFHLLIFPFVSFSG